MVHTHKSIQTKLSVDRKTEKQRTPENVKRRAVPSSPVSFYESLGALKSFRHVTRHATNPSLKGKHKAPEINILVLLFCFPGKTRDNNDTAYIKNGIPHCKKNYQKHELYHPGISVRGKMSKILFLSTAPIVFRAFPCNAHHHGNDDSNLNRSDDGCDKNVVELLSAGDHVQDVEVLGLLALGTLVAGVTAAGGDVVFDLTFPMHTDTVCTGDPGVEAVPCICMVYMFRFVGTIRLEQAAIITLANFLFVSGTSPKVFDVDLLLLHTGGLPYQTGVVV